MTSKNKHEKHCYSYIVIQGILGHMPIPTGRGSKVNVTIVASLNNCVNKVSCNFFWFANVFGVFWLSFYTDKSHRIKCYSCYYYMGDDYT